MARNMHDQQDGSSNIVDTLDTQQAETQVLYEMSRDDVTPQTRLDNAQEALQQSFKGFTEHLRRQLAQVELGDIKIPSLIEKRKKAFEEGIREEGLLYQKLLIIGPEEKQDQFRIRCEGLARDIAKIHAKRWGKEYKLEGRVWEKAVDAVTRVVAKVATKMRNFFKKSAIVLKTALGKNGRKVVKELFKTGLQVLKTGIATIANAVHVNIEIAQLKWKHSHVMKDVVGYIADNAKLATLKGTKQYDARSASIRKTNEDSALERQENRELDRNNRIRAEEARRAKYNIRTREQAGKRGGGRSF